MTPAPSVRTRTDSFGDRIVVELAEVEIAVEVDDRGIVDAALVDPDSGIRLFSIDIGVA